MPPEKTKRDTGHHFFTIHLVDDDLSIQYSLMDGAVLIEAKKAKGPHLVGGELHSLLGGLGG